LCAGIVIHPLQKRIAIEWAGGAAAFAFNQRLPERMDLGLMFFE